MSAAAQDAIREERGRRGIRVSSVSVWELLMLVRKGRLELAVSPDAFLRRAERLSYIEYVPIDNQIARAAVELPDVHADPADRLILATAVVLSCPLVSKDRRFADYDIRIVW